MANKSDVEPRAEDIFDELKIRFPKEEAFLISAKHGYGIGAFVKKLRNNVEIIKKRDEKSKQEESERKLNKEFDIKLYG